MKKIHSIPVIIILFAAALLFTWSCGEENPVTTPPPEPQYEYDSARFSWKVDTLLGYGFIAGLWAPDTNEMLIPNEFTNTLVHIKNGIKTFIPYPKENRLGAIFGDDNNDGYRIGAMLLNKIYQPIIQKWDGNNFVNIPHPQNLDRNFFYWSAYVKNSSEMWIGLTDGTVIQFNGSSFIHYPLINPDLVITKFFYDESNSLKFIAYDPHYNIDRIEHLIYELRNGQWVKIYSDFDNDINGPLDYDVIGPSIAPMGLHEIYELIDSSATPRINVPVFSFYLTLAGSSYSNVLIAASERFSNCDASLFHWNGKKWSLELCNYEVGFDADLLILSENIYYALSYDNAWNETYIMLGVKKISQKN